MTIEFAGLPGSGKSTIARRLAEADGTTRQVVAPWWLGLLHHPIRAAAHTVRPGAIGQRSGWPAWVVLWLRSMAQVGTPDKPGAMVILEEGITHHLWRAMFRHSAIDRAPWPELLRQPHPLVVLDADRATRFARIGMKRGQGRVNRQLAEAGPEGEAWTRGEELFERILERAAAHRSVVRVSTEGTVETAAERVREAIEGLVGER